MSDETESVKIRAVTMAVIREWAEASGRTVSALASDILGAAAMHYLDGTKQGLRLTARIVNTVPRPGNSPAGKCPQCGKDVFPVVGGAPHYRETGQLMCVNVMCPQKAFFPKPNGESETQAIMGDQKLSKQIVDAAPTLEEDTRLGKLHS